MNFTDFEACLDYIKGKQIEKSKRGAKRSNDLFEIIHTNICCPDNNDMKYFIMISQIHVSLLAFNSEALDVFKVFNIEVKKQYGK